MKLHCANALHLIENRKEPISIKRRFERGAFFKEKLVDIDILTTVPTIQLQSTSVDVKRQSQQGSGCLWYLYFMY